MMKQECVAQNNGAREASREKQKNVVVKATFRWPYTAPGLQRKIHQMTFGDYLKQQHERGE